MKRLFENRTAEFVCVILTLTSLTLIKVFPFYLGGLYTKFFSTHVIAKLLLVIVFLFTITKHFYRKQNSIRHKNPDVVWFSIFSLIYITAASLSVIIAIDVSAYIKQLQNIIFHGMYFYVGYLLLSNKQYKKILFYYFFFVGICIIIFDMTFLIVGNQILTFINDFVQIEIMALFTHNSRMGRFNSYLTLDSFIPIFFLTYYISKKQKKDILLLIFTVVLSSILSYTSLFRTRLLQGVFALLASLLVFFEEKKQLIATLLLIPITLSIVYGTTKLVAPSSTSIIERFFLTDSSLDIDTIEFRFTSLQTALELLSSSPIVGIGLGNYGAYINKLPGFSIEERLQKIHYEETLNNPHSVFIEVVSETGLLGLLGYVGILCYFLYKDIPILLKSGDKYTSSIIVLAWTLFLYGIFNPFNTVYIAGWFWFIRGYIQSQYETSLSH